MGQWIVYQINTVIMFVIYRFRREILRLSLRLYYLRKKERRQKK